MKNCCHHGNIDYSNIEIDFNQEPVKNEDGTYEIKASSITSIGHHSVDGWKQIINMHVCAAIGCAAISGLVIGALVTHLIKR